MIGRRSTVRSFSFEFPSLKFFCSIFVSPRCRFRKETGSIGSFVIKTWGDISRTTKNRSGQEELRHQSCVRSQRQEIGRLLKITCCSGCSKTSRCKAPEIPKSEAYIEVRRNDAPCEILTLRVGAADLAGRGMRATPQVGVFQQLVRGTRQPRVLPAAGWER